MHLEDYIDKRLEHTGLSPGEFRELLIRLMNYGVLARSESQTERELYDRFVRLEELTGETLTPNGRKRWQRRDSVTLSGDRVAQVRALGARLGGEIRDEAGDAIVMDV